jgi:hypothetical protein
MHPRVNRRGIGIDRSTGFEQDCEILVAEPGEQRGAFRLRERLAACYFNEWAAVGANRLDDTIDRLLRAAMKGVFCIAPCTAERAPCQAHEDAGPSGECRFALDAMEYFGDAHHPLFNSRALNYRHRSIGHFRRLAVRAIPLIGFTTVG